MLYASRLATKVVQLSHAPGYLSSSTNLYSCQGPLSKLRYKRHAKGRPGCTVLCTQEKEVHVWGQLTAVSSVRFLASNPWTPWMSYLVNRAQEGSLVACTGTKNDASVPK